MKFELKKVRRNIPEVELIADVKNTALKLNQDFVTIEQQDEFGTFDSSNIKKRVGSWAEVHIKAGLSLARHQKSQKLTDDELLENLEEVWIKLGRQPIQSDMFPPLSKFSAGVYKKHFDTWMNALEIFVKNINDEEKFLPEFSDKISGTITHKTKRDINSRLRFIIMKRDNFKCKNCGRSPATDKATILHIDHIKPWSKGGETVQENLETLCSICNIGKSNLE